MMMATPSVPDTMNGLQSNWSPRKYVADCAREPGRSDGHDFGFFWRPAVCRSPDGDRSASGRRPRPLPLLDPRKPPLCSLGSGFFSCSLARRLMVAHGHRASSLLAFHHLDRLAALHRSAPAWSYLVRSPLRGRVESQVRLRGPMRLLDHRCHLLCPTASIADRTRVDPGSRWPSMADRLHVAVFSDLDVVEHAGDGRDQSGIVDRADLDTPRSTSCICCPVEFLISPALRPDSPLFYAHAPVDRTSKRARGSNLHCRP